MAPKDYMHRNAAFFQLLNSGNIVRVTGDKRDLIRSNGEDLIRILDHCGHDVGVNFLLVIGDVAVINYDLETISLSGSPK